MELLQKIKILTNITDTSNDAVLSLLIDNAKSAFTDYTGRAATGFDSIICKMVVEDWNRIGNEGLSSVSFGSISETNLQDYSDGLQKQIRRRKKVGIY